ncbi:hypothetical protein SAMN04488689_1011, partial [Paenibacillus sp. cl6col]|uniref:hypothetical protein n=2 Tax=Paenibacillus TaxID=44249 RepID=UPI00088A4C70
MSNEYLRQPGQQQFRDLVQQVNEGTSNPVSYTSNSASYGTGISSGYGMSSNLGSGSYGALNVDVTRGASLQPSGYLHSYTSQQSEQNVVPNNFQSSGYVGSITSQTHGAQQNVVPNSFQPTGQVQSITAQTHGAHQNVVPNSFQP